MNINPQPLKRPASPYSQETRLALERKKIQLQKAEMTQKKFIGPESPKKQRSKIRLIIYSLIILIILSITGFISFNLYRLQEKVIVENVGDQAPILKTKMPSNLLASMVKKDGDSRINILITGMGGKGHSGGSLTDSIQVLSIDPFNNEAGIVSLPRDLSLTIKNKTVAKLNTVYQTGQADAKNGGGVLMKDKVGDILDLDIHYFINVDFQGFIEIVDALGGIKVNVEKTINDPYFPDARLEGYEPFYIKAGIQTLDGKTALKYARSRKTTSDFDRSSRQQQIIIALKEKAFSLGTLTNPTKISEIINIVGDHLKTDIQISEMQELAKRYNQINSLNVQTKVVDNSQEGPLMNASYNGSYSLIPKLGLDKFDQVQNFSHEVLVDPKIKLEAAKIEIYYPEERSKEAKAMIDKLTSYGYIINDGGIDLRKEINHQDTLIVRKSLPFTTKYLKNRYPNLIEKKERASSEKTDITIYLGDE